MNNLTVIWLLLAYHFLDAKALTFGAKRTEKSVPGQVQIKLGVMKSNTHTEYARREIVEKAAVLSTFLLTPSPSHAMASYSQNARNFERLASGDESGGSVYENNPTAKGAKRRRAMTGCKIASAREEAAGIIKVPSLSEKDCNLKVMDEDSEFMLQAMRKLECPTCPYGVNPQR
jgi:hypothetical protein